MPVLRLCQISLTLLRNPEVLAEALKNCASNEGSSGAIKECPILRKSNVDNFKWQCPERAPQVGEQVVGVMDKLPGWFVKSKKQFP